jgi:hypothetical protein
VSGHAAEQRAASPSEKDKRRRRPASVSSHPIPVSGCSPLRHCALKTLLKASQSRRRPHLLRPWRTVTVEPLTAEQPSRLHAQHMPCSALPCLALPCPSFWEQQQQYLFHWRAPAGQGALAQTRVSYPETMTYNYCCHSQLINSESFKFAPRTSLALPSSRSARWSAWLVSLPYDCY